MPSRFVNSTWGPNDIALLNHEIERLSRGLDERPIIVEQEFTGPGPTKVRHSLGVKIRGVLVISGNISEPSAQDRNTWDNDTVYLRCSGTFPQNVVLALWGSGEERFQTIVTSLGNARVSGNVAVVDTDESNVTFTSPSSLFSDMVLYGLDASIPAASASNSGFLYFSSDLHKIYRSNGTTWDNLTPTLDTVVAAGATLSTNYSIDLAYSTLLKTVFEDIDTTVDLDYYGGRVAFSTALSATGQLVVGKDSQWGVVCDTTGPQATSSVFGVVKLNTNSVGSSVSTVVFGADNRLNGPFNHPSCRAVSVANVASKSGTTTIDGVSLVSGDRVLLTAQSTASQNGPWTIASGSWTRPSDWNNSNNNGALYPGAMIYVTEGTTYADTIWQCTTNATITVDTTSTAWRDYHSVQPAVTYSGDQTVNANLILNTAGNLIKIKEGTNAAMGEATLVAGTVTVSTTKALTRANGGRYHLTCALVGGTQGMLSIGTITNATSFVINSSNAADTSTIHWMIFQTA